MAKTQIKEVKIWHEAIMDEIIAMGPSFTLKTLSEKTGYTVPWLSILLNSDMFQMKLRKRREAISARVETDIGARLKSVAHESLKKMEVLLKVETDISKVNDTAELLLTSLGYLGKNGQGSSTPTSVQVVNVVGSDKDSNIVAEARARIGKKGNNGANLLPSPASESAGSIIDSGADIIPNIQET